MTRDEAIATFTRESDLDDLAAAIIDGLEALGILKLDEPKSVEDRFFDIANTSIGNVSASVLWSKLDSAGLRIMEK